MMPDAPLATAPVLGGGAGHVRDVLAPADLLALAICAGVLTGYGEALLSVGVREGLLHRGVFQGRDFLWMAAAAEAVLFLAAGAALVAAGSRWPVLRTSGAAALALAFLAALTLALQPGVLHPVAAVLLASGAAVQVSRLAGPRGGALRRLGRRAWLPLAASVALVALVVRADALLAERLALARLPAPSADAPHVLLIVLDTVRARSVSAHGHARATTPNLERLAVRGVRFDNALAAACWTPPSHATLFTGRWPHELLPAWDAPLGETHATLAERLAARGYATGGFVANAAYAGWEQGFDRGFTRYEDYPVSWQEMIHAATLSRRVANARRLRNLLGWRDVLGRKRAGDVNAAALHWIDGLDPNRPFFAFLNYLDAHEPYLPPAPFAGRFGPTGPRDFSETTYSHHMAERMHRERMSARETQAELNAYEASIAAMDHEIGRLLAALAARGELDRTLVVVTSDHGEAFGEHGIHGHGRTLYRELLGVPLVLAHPDLPHDVRVSEPVSLRDLPATILELAGAGDGPGSSLARFWSGAREVADRRPILSEYSGASPTSDGGARFRFAKSLVHRGYHYIRNGDGSEELYDFAGDPMERHDLSRAPEHAPALRALRTALDDLLARGGAAAPAPRGA